MILDLVPTMSGLEAENDIRIPPHHMTVAGVLEEVTVEVD